MIRFPEGFVKTKYHGYVWNVKEEVLYSFKGGTLRPLKLKPEYKGVLSHTGKYAEIPEHYQISVEGQRRTVTTKYLMKLVKNAKDTQYVDYKKES